MGRKSGLALVTIGVFALLFGLILPMTLRANPVSRNLLTPLLCRIATEDFYSYPVYRIADDGALTFASPVGYCVSHRGNFRDVTRQQLIASLLVGGVPLLIGLRLLRRSERLKSHDMRSVRETNTIAAD